MAKFTVETKLAPHANPNRGYHANICRVEFSEGEDGGIYTQAAQKEWVEILRKVYRPRYMWCYEAKELQENVWEFEYGYDSGD